MKEWFIFQGEGNPAGPFTTELLARGILAGKVARDAYVAGPGDPQWVGVMTVAEVAAMVDSMERSGAPVQPRPINTVPPAPAPKRDTRPEEFKPLFDMAPTPPPIAPAPSQPQPNTPSRPAFAPPAYVDGAPEPTPPPAQAAALAPAPAPAPSPAPAAAPAPAPAAAPAPEAKPAEAKPAEAKKEEPKAPPLSPKFRLIPIGIFAVCFVLSIVVFGVSRVIGGPEKPPAGQHSGQAK